MNKNEELTPQDLADRWGITRIWLYNLRKKGQTPKEEKRGIGKKPRYIFRLSEVEKFEREHFS